MSFKLSRAKLKGLTAKHIVIIGLLFVHSAWIITHLNLVSRGLINPWKLGGYGMYTQPDYKAKLRVYDINTKSKLIMRKKYKARNFRNANLRYVFRCREISEDAFIVFFNDNPHLVNTDIRFTLSERKFSRSPVAVKRIIYSTADIRWGKEEKFTYSGEICGDDYLGMVEFKP